MGLYKRCKCPKPERCAHTYWGTFRGVRRSLEKVGKREAHTKTVAQAIFDQMKQDIRAGVFEAGVDEVKTIVLTFRELADLYTQRHINNPEKPLHHAVTGRVQMAVKKFGDLPIDAIKTVDVEAYFAELAQPARIGHGQHRERRRSRATMNRHKAILGHLFTWAVERGHAKRHPFFNEHGARIIKQRDEDNRRERVLTHAEEDLLLLHASPAMRDRIIFALDTGLRRGEQQLLLIDDFDADPGWVRVRGVNAKSGKTRFVPLATARVQDVVTRLRKDLDGTEKPSGTFAFAEGGHLHEFRGSWQALCAKLTLHDLRWHDLRATFATRMLEEGEPISRVRNLLGHSSVAVTERYDRMAREGLRTSVAALEASITKVAQLREAREQQERSTAA